MTAAAPFSTHAALSFANRQTVCYTDPWGYRGHKFPRDAGDTDRCFCSEITKGEYARAGARLWNGGVLRSAMARWLFEVAQVTVWTLGRDIQSGYDPVIRRLASDTDADESSLAWCATKERAASCRAGLIIGPWDADTDHPASAIATSNDPKRTFAELTAHFFPAAPLRWDASDAIVGSRTPLAPGVVIGPDVVLGNDVIIGPNTVIANATIGHGARIGANCTIGLDGFGFVKGSDGEWMRFPQRGRVVIGDRVEIGSNTCIDRGALSDTIIEAGAKIDNLVHIAHNCRIGARALVIANVTLCGGTIIEPDAWVAPSATIREQRTIGHGATVGLGAVVTKDVDADTTVLGNPARPR